jgi:hypothetical protein
LLKPILKFLKVSDKEQADLKFLKMNSLLMPIHNNHTSLK